jgi:hypothetical protein
MDTSEPPQVLEGQISIEDLLGEPTFRRPDEHPAQGCLPLLGDVPPDSAGP